MRKRARASEHQHQLLISALRACAVTSASTDGCRRGRERGGESVPGWVVLHPLRRRKHMFFVRWRGFKRDTPGIITSSFQIQLSNAHLAGGHRRAL